MLCNQFRHTASQDLECLYAELIFILNYINKFIQLSTVVQKQEELSIYFCILRGYINTCN